MMQEGESEPPSRLLPGSHGDAEFEDRIGQSVFSKAWVLSLLVRAVEVVQEEGSASNHKGERSDLEDGVSVESGESELESDLCTLWDASVNNDVGLFIHKQHGVPLLFGMASRSTSPRLTEICIGLLGNLACLESICLEAFTSSQLIHDITLFLAASTDTRILHELTRLVHICVSHETVQLNWLKEIKQLPELANTLTFILKESTNEDLLQSTAALVDTLLDASEELLKQWVGRELVEALCEAAKQTMECRSAVVGTLLATLQLLTTLEDGVACIVSCEELLTPILISFIVASDPLDLPQQPAMAALSLLATLTHNSSDVSSFREKLTKDGSLRKVLLNWKDSLSQSFKEQHQRSEQHRDDCGSLSPAQVSSPLYHGQSSPPLSSDHNAVASFSSERSAEKHMSTLVNQLLLHYV